MKVKLPTHKEVRAVNRAMIRVTNALDKFETECVKNGLKVKRITYRASDGEFSDVKFDLKEIR